MKSSAFLSTAFITLFVSLSANAIVDMKNANYSNTWLDFEVPGSGYDMRVSRTYNSRSLFNGIFGYGWCSDFETNLEKTAEGNIKLTECGAGQEIVFTPREFDKKDIEKTIATIVGKVRDAKKADAKRLQELAKDMMDDPDLRARFATSYRVATPVKEGSVYYANGKEVDKITFAKAIYTRVLADGSQMKFSNDGKLLNMFDKNGNFLKMEYDKDQLSTIVDNNGRRISFKYYANKKVKEVVGPNNAKAEYKFANLDDLSQAKSGENVYNYEYDDAHNLTKASYPDKTSVQIRYDTKNDWVMSFVDREKCNEEYTYEFDQKEPKLHYWSTVKKTCNKEVVNNSKHEFWYAARFDGPIYLKRVASTINGNVTDISYHEVFGKPLVINRNNERTTFSYYSNGLVQTKLTRFAKMDFTYDMKTFKVTAVSTGVLNEGGKVTATKKSIFRWDGKGNLAYAENTDGQKINLTYDARGRIATIVDQAKRVVKIDYEEKFGKPAVVTRPGLGTLKVSYKANGDVDKVASQEGPTVAMQVASTFNNLLDVIAPATAEVFN